MKTPLITSLILTLAVSALYGSYALFFETESQPPVEKFQPEIKSISKAVRTVQFQPVPETHQPTLQPAVKLEKTISDPANLYAALNQTLTSLSPNQVIKLPNLQAIAHCPSCLKLLQDFLLSGKLNRKQSVELANKLTEGNHPELAHLLIETIEKSTQTNGIENDSPLINALAKFNSSTVAKEFINYLTHAQEIPMQLSDALNSNLNQTTKRLEVANEIMAQFNANSDNTVRDRLLAINHPEALAKINTQALAQGDVQLVKQTSDLLSSNPSKYAIDAVLDLFHTQQQASNSTEMVLSTAYQLAQRQFSGNRLDYIEARLAGDVYSEQDKAVVLAILAQSEDAERANRIIAKY